MKNLDEAAYKGNIGVMELVKFHSKASPAQKSKFTELINGCLPEKPRRSGR